MANKKCCDICGKIINDVWISLIGYKVELKQGKRFPGYTVGEPQDFCSFNCLAEYAKKQQEILDDVQEVFEKHDV